MLKIRSEQFAPFQPITDALFTNKIAEYMKKHHAEDVVKLPTGVFLIKNLPEATLQTLIRNSCAHARQYGLTWESNVAAFVVLTFVVAPNFDAHPSIQAILANGTTVPDSRIERLWEQTTEEDWDAANRRYNADAWQMPPEKTEI